MAELNCRLKAPGDCTPVEVQRFYELVEESGEVTIDGLLGRIRGAVALGFLTDGNELVGVAGLKHPNPHYRAQISERSEVTLAEADYPYELGWVYIRSVARGRHGTPLLLDAALQRAVGEGVYATSATDKATMHYWLQQKQFRRVGKPYASNGREILVFVRSAQ